MSKKKTLLEEGTVRRFMKLAEMAPLSTDFINEMYPPMADDDEAEEAVPADATPAEADYDEAEFEAGEEAGEEDAADEMDLELDMDDDPMTDEAASGELTLTDEEAEVFLKVADKVRAAMEAEGGIEDLPAPDMGDEDVEVVDMEMDAPEMGDDLDVDVEEEEEVELQETGAKRTGASKGDKGKDPKDPSARDYTDEGDREGDESETHKGDKDYTTKKGTKLKHSGKGRGEKKGDKAYVNEDIVNEIASRVAKRVLKAKKK